MVDSYLSTKIGVNSLDGFWENAFYGWTPDAHATALALLTQSSRAKNYSRKIVSEFGDYKKLTIF